MAATMEKTRYPGIYRRGSRYVATYYVGGRQRKKSARTLDEAKQIRAERELDSTPKEASRKTVAEYLSDWVESYHGTGRRGFRETTRADYRRLLAMYIYPYFSEVRPRKMAEVTPGDVKMFIKWLCDSTAQADLEIDLGRREAAKEARATGKRPREPMRVRKARVARERADRAQRAIQEASEQGDPLAVEAGRTRLAEAHLALERATHKQLSESTIRNVLNPLRAGFATAKQDDDVRSNPTSRCVIPSRGDVEKDEEETVRVLSREQLAMLLRLANPRYRLLFRLLAATGLRISEAIGLEWRHLALDGSRPHVKVRQAVVRGRVGKPKTKHSRRDVPISASLVSELRRHRAEGEWTGDRDPVFASGKGRPLDPNNLRRYYLAPIVQELDVAFDVGFHTLRHTCASLLFDGGRNVVQVQKWLGHHAPSFTIDTYVHLLPGDVAEPLELDLDAQGGIEVAIGQDQTQRDTASGNQAESALAAGFASLD